MELDEPRLVENHPKIEGESGNYIVAVNETDQDLIQACRKGDARAWERVLERYERLVYSIPLHYGLPGEDAADLVQITFTILLQSLDNLQENTHLAAWLSTVARRHTWRLLERRRREQAAPDEDLAEMEWVGGADEHPERWERLEWITAGLSRLGDRCRELLLALYFDPLEPTYEEVALRLAMPVGSIGPTRSRCLERLKRHLAALVES